MTSFSSFFIIINAGLLAYAGYSWYWQAHLALRGRFRVSVLLWTLLMIWFGFTWNYIIKGNASVNFFLALILLISIMDGFTGLAPKRAVVSGYFKRTVPYSEITDVRLIRMPLTKRPLVVCLLGTNKGRNYLLQFRGTVSQIINVLRKYADHRIRVHVQDGL